VSQTKSFFLRQHERHLQKLGAILAQEQWKHEKEVEPSFQRVVDELTVVDAEGVAKALERRVDPKPDPAASKVPHPDLLTSPDLVPAPQFLQPPDVPRQSLLSIANRGYPVGASVLLLVQLLGEYDRCLMTFPYIAVDILQRVHDLLKAYDSQASRLVLGAAAIETAGLKSITTYHLALAAQSLSFVRTLVAFLRARYLGLLPPRHAVFVSNMFDRLCKDITAHRAEFDMKIVGIMCDRLTGSPELAIDPSKWADHGSAHIRALVAEIGRLWKVLKQYFHLDQTQAIFVETVKHYNAHLRDVFLRMPLEDSGLRERVAGDVKNYRVNIERFGIAVLPGDTSLNTEEAILAYFLGPREAPCSP
jgi:vacuolar protein sorting-associated protein 54